MTRLRHLCAICKTPIRQTKRGWEHVKALAKFGGHKPVLKECLEPYTATDAAQEARG